MSEERMSDKEFEARYDAYVRAQPQAAAERLMMHFIAERHALETAIKHEKDLARTVALSLLPPAAMGWSSDDRLIAAEDLIQKAEEALKTVYDTRAARAPTSRLLQ